jgi:hypothetical protein
MKIERKKDASCRFLPLDVDGWVDVVLVMLADFITYHHMGAQTNIGVSADVQSSSRSGSLHGSRTLLRCLHRNMSCGDHEREVILGCTDAGKKLELLNMFNPSVCVERVRCKLEFNELSQNTHASGGEPSLEPSQHLFVSKMEKAAPLRHSEENSFREALG